VILGKEELGRVVVARPIMRSRFNCGRPLPPAASPPPPTVPPRVDLLPSDLLLLLVMAAASSLLTWCLHHRPVPTPPPPSGWISYTGCPVTDGDKDFPNWEPYLKGPNSPEARPGRGQGKRPRTFFGGEGALGLPE
jgi:hypothetical protein